MKARDFDFYLKRTYEKVTKDDPAASINLTGGGILTSVHSVNS